jgi:hypothetical protein
VACSCAHRDAPAACVVPRARSSVATHPPSDVYVARCRSRPPTTQVWISNKRQQIQRLVAACKELAKHGPMRPEEARGLDEVRCALRLRMSGGCSAHAPFHVAYVPGRLMLVRFRRRRVLVACGARRARTTAPIRRRSGTATRRLPRVPRRSTRCATRQQPPSPRHRWTARSHSRAPCCRRRWTSSAAPSRWVRFAVPTGGYAARGGHV